MLVPHKKPAKLVDEKVALLYISAKQLEHILKSRAPLTSKIYQYIQLEIMM
jgi:hypothetical protein